jgi:Pentapeptide repeats (8 copies)
VERKQFDRFVRLLGVAGSRRAALCLVTGALLGAAGTLESTTAGRRRNRGRVRAQQSLVVPCPGPPTLRDCTNKKLGPGANLSQCDFIEKVFPSVNLSGANVSGASFFDAELFGPPNFRGANASNVCFGGEGGNASLAFADFRGANVRGSNFCGNDLRGADFRGSNITAEQLSCAFVGCDTILPNGKPVVPCTADQVCCGALCCDPKNCEQGTCLVAESACGGGPCNGDPDCPAPCLCGPFGNCVGPDTCPGGPCSGGPGQQGTCKSTICNCTAAENGTCEAPLG